MLRSAWLGWLALPLVVSLPATATPPPTLAGTWSATAMQANWVVGDWGSACGPKPGGSEAPAGTVVITQKGEELVFTGAGRTYSTTECWEQNSSLFRVSHVASSRAYKNVCRSAPNDPRQATIITTITATDTQITFDETGQYQFVVAGQNCTASVRRTRYLRLIQREGEAPPPPKPAAPAPSATTPPPAEPPATAAKPSPAPATAPCATKGAPARLEVRPAHKLLRPGETFTFRASVLDKAGCTLNVTPTFRLVDPPPGAKLVAPGTLQIESTAPEGELKLLASVGERAVAVVAEVVSADRYEALLSEGRFDALGESDEVAVTRIESASLGARETTLRDEGVFRKKLFVGVVGALALGLGVFGFVTLRRSRKAERAARSRRRAPAVATSTAPTPARGVTEASARVMVCPTCREEYPPDAKFCAHDGNRLVPLQPSLAMAPTGGVCPVCGKGYDPGVSVCPKHDEPLVPPVVHEAAQNEKRLIGARKICPVCGSCFAGDSQFCGNCGASLVPVN